MRQPAVVVATALVICVLGQPSLGAGGQEYEPTAEEISAFEQAIMNRSARPEPEKKPGSEYADHNRFTLVPFVVPTLSLQRTDEEIVEQILSGEQAAARVSKFQSEICRQLTSDSVSYVDTDYLLRTMVEGQDSIYRHQAEAYDQMRRRMSTQGFAQLNTAIDEMLSTAQSTETDPIEIFSFGADIVKWQMKRNCGTQEPATHQQGDMESGQ